MSDPTKIQALQYIFDVSRQAPVAAPIHEQAQKYAQFLAQSFDAPAPATLKEAVEAIKPPTDRQVAMKPDVNDDAAIG